MLQRDGAKWVCSSQKEQKNQRQLYQMLQYDEAKGCVQVKMQILSQTRKSDNLNRQSANKRIHRTLNAPLILGDRLARCAHEPIGPS